MSTDLVLIIIVMVAGFAALYFLLRRNTPQSDLEATVNKVFGMSAQKVAEQSKQILQGEKEIIKTDLNNKQHAIEELVKNLQLDIKVQQQEIRSLEQDRTKSFTELKTALTQHRQQTDELRVSTQQLASVLSNNQQRGDWGERIIEDLLLANGLMEGVHYLKQSRQTSDLRPDITLLLPNDRNVPVDVKFPYAAIQKMADTEGKAAKDILLKQFSSDVRIKVTKVAAYINPAEKTLDYAILFVPNEMIFSFINQKFPEIVDEALRKRVLIVSPFTFLIVARTIMESYRNFMLSDRLREVVQSVDEFVSEWDKFKDKFTKYGRSLSTLTADYEELTGTRMRQMDRKLDKIENYRQGTLLGDGEEPTP